MFLLTSAFCFSAHALHNHSSKKSTVFKSALVMPLPPPPPPTIPQYLLILVGETSFENYVNGAWVTRVQAD